MKKKVLGILVAYMLCYQMIFAIDMPNIQSEGAILIESKTNTVLYTKNGHKKFYPASITKILTALLCVEGMSEDIVITKSTECVKVVPSDSSHIGLGIGESFTVKNALYGLLMGSDNFIAYDLAVRQAGSISQFVETMNQRAKSMGATQTNFTNPHGYHDIEHYTTPYDMAQIARGVFDNKEVAQIAGTRNYLFKLANKNKTINLKNTSRLLDAATPYYNPNVIATKTGWHDDAGQTLVAKAKYGDLELIAVTMKTKTPNQYQDVNALFKYGSQYFSVDKIGEDYTLQNQTYSQFGEAFVAYAKAQKWELPAGKNYQGSLTYQEWIDILGNILGKERIATTLKDYANSNPDTSIKRKEVALLLQKVLTDLQVRATVFNKNPNIQDIGQVEGKYQEAIVYAVSTQLLGAKDLPFYPEQTMTYEQGLCVAYRIMTTCSGILK